MSRQNSHNTQASSASIASRHRRRLSRSDTNTFDLASGIDLQSIQTLDQLSTARASVAMLDKLWTQIDVLDDVKKMAEEVNERGSFLSEKFTALLGQLKESQQRLLDVMAKHAEKSEQNRMRRKKGARETADRSDLSSDAIKRESEDTKKRMQEFFFSQSKDDDNPQRRDFDELNEYVGEVQHHMTDVGEHMKTFDEEMKKLW